MSRDIVSYRFSFLNIINNNLEQQAEAIFKSWFVDFEPFGGKLPEDWVNCTFGDVVKNIRTKVKDNNYTVFSAISTGVLQPSVEFFTKQVFSKDISKYIIVEQKDFAYNPARINIGSIGLNTYDFTGCVSPVYVVFRVEKGYEHYFNHYIKRPCFKEAVKSRASGSVRQTLNFNELQQIPIIYPNKQYANQFNEFCDYLLRIKVEIQQETEKLEDLRDTLFPKLMSGELDVSNIDL